MLEFKGMGEAKDKFFDYLDSILSRSRNTDPETSKQAAEKIDFDHKHFHAIVKCLEEHGPLGKDGIAAIINLDGHQVGKRLGELEKLGLIAQTGRIVKSKSNRNEREWKSC